MTVKRFEYKNHKVYDNLTGETHSSNMVSVNVLNELHEENQDFKAFNKELAEELSVCSNARISKDNRIKRLEEKIQRERISFAKTHERWSKEAETKIKELSEENEQLKQDNNALIHLLENQSIIIQELHSKLLEYQVKEPIVLTKEDLELMGKAVSYYTHGRCGE